LLALSHRGKDQSHQHSENNQSSDDYEQVPIRKTQRKTKVEVYHQYTRSQKYGKPPGTGTFEHYQPQRSAGCPLKQLCETELQSLGENLPVVAITGRKYHTNRAAPITTASSSQ
jgi:hypothetical protein